MVSGSVMCGASSSALKILRNDVSQPTSIGFMKPIPDEDLAKQSEVSTLITDNLKILEEIPLQTSFTIEQISDVFKKKLQNEIKDDPLRKIASDLSSYASNFYQKMELYFNNIFDFEAELKKRKNAAVFSISKEFLLSDFPSCYVQAISSSFITEIKFLELFDYRIRRERLQLRVVRKNNIKFRRICDFHNLWVDGLNPLHDSMVESRTKLLWYVDIHNCAKINEAFELKKLKKAKISMDVFHGLVLDLDRRTAQFRKALIDLDPNIFQAHPNRDDATVNLLCNSVELINELN